MSALNFLRSRSSWIIFLLALAARICQLLTLKGVPHQLLFGDSFLFDHYGQLLANGTLAQAVGTEGVPMPPLYIAFLGSLYYLFGHNILIPKIIQIVLGSLSAVLLYKIGKRLWNKEAGILAGLIGAFYGIFIFYDTELLKNSLANSLLIGTFYLLLRKKREPDLLHTSLAAVTFTLAALLREQLIVLLPAVILWMFVSYRKGKLRIIQAAFLFLFLGLALPPAINSALFTCLPKSYGLGATSGIHFFIGNNPKANGTYMAIAGVSAFPRGHVRDAKRLAEETAGHPLTPREINRYWYQQSFGYIRSHPSRWIELEGKKLFLLFNHYEVPNDESYPFARKGSWFLQWPLFTYAFVCPLGLVGILLQRKEALGSSSLLILFVLFYSGVLLMTFITSAYRLPLHPVFILFTGYAVTSLWEACLQKQFARLFFGIVILAIFYPLSNSGTYLSEKDYEKKMNERLQFLSRSKGHEAAAVWGIVNSGSTGKT